MQSGQNPFTNPDAPGGGEKAPRPRDMVGALVAYSPRIFTPAGAPGNTTGVGKSEPRDRVTADLIILETPAPIMFGGSPEWDQGPKPHTHTVTGPARFTGVWVSNGNIVKALAPGGQPLVGAMVLGRIERSTQGQLPFNLVAVVGTPDMDKAVQIYSALNLGQLAYNEPQLIAGGAYAVPAPANTVSYAPPVAAPQPVVDPAYAAWQAQQAAQAAGMAAVQAGFPGAQVIPGYPVAPPAPVAPPPPVGWTQAGWDGLSPEQKAQVQASLPAQPPTPF
jgi:hypothetical protein